MQFNHVPNAIAEELAQRIVEVHKPESRSVVLHRTYGEENHQFAIQLGFGDREVMRIVARLEGTAEDLETSAWLSLEHAIGAINHHIRRYDAMIYYSPVDLAPIRVSAVLRAILDVLPGFGSDAEVNIWYTPDTELNIRAKNLKGHPDAGLTITIPLPQATTQQQSN